jgi:hypothetical protein
VDRVSKRHEYDINCKTLKKKEEEEEEEEEDKCSKRGERPEQTTFKNRNFNIQD